MVAVILALGLILGSSAMVMAAPAAESTGPEETQEITAQEPETIEPTAAADEDQAEVAGETEEGQAEITGETADGQEEDSSEPADETAEEAEEDLLGIANENADDQTEEQTAEEKLEDVLQESAEEENGSKVPLDFNANPESRSGEGWAWDKDSATLTISNCYIDLMQYEEDYNAAIVFPDDVDTATIVTSDAVLIEYTGANLGGKLPYGIYCPGNLVIQGDGIFQIGPPDYSGTGIYVGGSLEITGTSESSLLGFHADAIDYTIYSGKNLTLKNLEIQDYVIGISGGEKNTSFYAETGIEIENCDLSMGTDGPVTTGLFTAGGAISLNDVTFGFFPRGAQGTISNAIVNNDADITIDGSTLMMTVASGDQTPAMFISTEKGDIQINNSEILGASNSWGIYAADGEVSITENSTLDIKTADTCLAAGTGLTVEKSFVSAKSEEGPQAVYSSGPVEINNSQIYLEAKGEKSVGLMADLNTEDKVTIKGDLTYMDLAGKTAAIQITTSQDVTDDPVVLDDVELITPEDAGINFVDDEESRYFSYSEGPLTVEGGVLKGASTNVILADKDGLYITGQPADQSVDFPNPAAFEVQVNNKSKVKSYQWVFENTDADFQTFNLDGEKGQQPNIVIPATRQSSKDWYFYCKITDTAGNEIQTRRALLTINNPFEKKAVLYVGWNALEAGDSLDLAKVNMGSGTISYDEDGTTITFDNVNLTNDAEGVIWWDRLIPTFTIRLCRANNQISDYNLILKGENKITSTYIQPSSQLTGMALDFEFYGGTVGSVVPTVHVKEDSAGGSLTIKGGETEFRVIGDLDLNANLTLENFTEEPLSQRGRLGIDCYGFNLASGYTADLDVNGIALATQGQTSICDGANVKINLTPMPADSAVVKPAIYVEQGLFEIGNGATVDITAHASPLSGLAVDLLGGIYLEKRATLKTNGATINIDMSADKGAKDYILDYTAIFGNDGSDMTFDQTNLTVNVDGTNVADVSGLYSQGNVSINDSKVLINAKAKTSTNGLAPEGDLVIKDSAVVVNTQYLGQKLSAPRLGAGQFDSENLALDAGEGSSIAIAAKTITIDLKNFDEDCVRANATNDDGIAMLAKTGEGGAVPKSFDPSYVAKNIVLKSDAINVVPAPKESQISLTSMPGVEEPYMYYETYYNLTNTEKPCNYVVIEALASPTPGPTPGPSPSPTPGPDTGDTSHMGLWLALLVLAILAAAGGIVVYRRKREK